MDILFSSDRSAAEFNDFNQLVRRYGQPMAKMIHRRLSDLLAARNLAEMRTLFSSGRCHELTGDRAGQISLDLKHPLRLIFEPAEEPIPRKADGGLDWKQVVSVRILEIAYTH